VPDGDDWFEKQVKQHLFADKKARKILSLGCGFGHVERRLMRLGIAEECLGVDIADMAIRSAQADAEKEGLHGLSFVVADLDNIDLSKSTYDVVWAHGCLHHFDKLERIISLSHSCLVRGGMFVAREVVGPDHQQSSSRTLEIINSALHLIPQRYRTVSEINRLPQWALSMPRRRNLYALWRLLTLRPMHFREDVQRAARGNMALTVYAALCPSRAKVESDSIFRFGKLYDNDYNYFKFIDPTEGIHSSEIIPAIQRVFGNADIRYFNGTLITYVFGMLNQRYFDDYDAKRGSAYDVMETLIYLDRAMTLSGEIPPSYAAIFATKR
jgi:SAM-dependent methyltransferase